MFYTYKEGDEATLLGLKVVVVLFTLAHWVFLGFILVIIATLIARKQPILPGALGILAVGLAERFSFPGALEIMFRALMLSMQNLLTIILLIGMVVALTKLLQDTGADVIITQPLQTLRNPVLTYWVLGVVMWGMTLFLWPTPAVTLLGAVLVPTLSRSGLNPMAIAMSLAIFGEGLGLSGDFVIQGAPSLLSKATGLPLASVLDALWPVVLASGLAAAAVGDWQQRRLSKHTGAMTAILPHTQAGNQGKSKLASKTKIEHPKNTNPAARMIGFLVLCGYAVAIAILILGKIKGDGASAIIGGVTLIILITGTLLKDRGNAFSTFVEYVRHGLRFSISTFTPIIIMAGFFFMGTATGTLAVFDRHEPGFFSDFATSLAHVFPLNKWIAGLFVMLTAMLGSMDGSGFSGLPLTGGIAVALSEAAGLPLAPLAVLGQIASIWTGAVLIPWGFAAVTAAVAGVEAQTLVKYNLPSYLTALAVAYLWTMMRL